LSSSFQQLNPEYLLVTGVIFHIIGTKKKTWLREERLNEGHSFGDGSAPWWRGQAEHFILYSTQEVDRAREREEASPKYNPLTDIPLCATSSEQAPAS